VKCPKTPTQGLYPASSVALRASTPPVYPYTTVLREQGMEASANKPSIIGILFNVSG
jgi:hypothetical protein